MAMVFETPFGRVEVPGELVREIISIELTSCFHWGCVGSGIDYVDVVRFMHGDKNPVLLRRIARYILVYAENLVLTTVVYLKVIDSGKVEAYLEDMRDVLESLREKYREVKGFTGDPMELRTLVDQMLHICLSAGLDPF